jgi:hypothetical protein
VLAGAPQGEPPAWWRGRALKREGYAPAPAALRLLLSSPSRPARIASNMCKAGQVSRKVGASGSAVGTTPSKTAECGPVGAHSRPFPARSPHPRSDFQPKHQLYGRARLMRRGVCRWPMNTGNLRPLSVPRRTIRLRPGRDHRPVTLPTCVSELMTERVIGKDTVSPRRMERGKALHLRPSPGPTPSHKVVSARAPRRSGGTIVARLVLVRSIAPDRRRSPSAAARLRRTRARAACDDCRRAASGIRRASRRRRRACSPRRTRPGGSPPSP